MRTRSRANFRRKKRKVERNAVLKEPVVGAGDALGHAGKTSEMFGVAAPPMAQVAPIIDPIEPRADPPY
jgi:hypothetical protein